jgi:hypothetical protein
MKMKLAAFKRVLIRKIESRILDLSIIDFIMTDNIFPKQRY